MNRDQFKQTYKKLIGSCVMIDKSQESSVDLEEGRPFDFLDHCRYYTDKAKIVALDATGCELFNQRIDLFIELLGRLDNLKLLIIDETNLHPKNLLKISEALNTLENLRYISAIQKTYNKKENFVKLIEVSKKIDIILKNNINVIYFALLDDENKQIKMFKNIQKEISKNMKCCFRRSVDIITIDCIKAIMDTNLDNFSDFESSASFVYIDQIRICLGCTLILNDSLFTNSYNKDFTYYLSQTHRVTCIEASDVSDTKIKHLFKLLLSENLNLKPIKKINFGKRNLDQKEFALLSMIVINFDEKFEGVKDFYWKDTFKNKIEILEKIND